jgi:hypothetical protein
VIVWVGAFMTKKYPETSVSWGERKNPQWLGEAMKKGTVTGWVGAFLMKKYPETSISWGEGNNLVTGGTHEKRYSDWVGRRFFAEQISYNSSKLG